MFLERKYYADYDGDIYFCIKQVFWMLLKYFSHSPPLSHTKHLENVIYSDLIYDEHLKSWACREENLVNLTFFSFIKWKKTEQVQHLAGIFSMPLVWFWAP